ncbi:MAG: YggS family pyridoxal phosphate-dependent enzyme [Pseudomonadota bacterium]|nr:YggS family pyridoxal phosphate-dependent enzyme [Pseudomonadota bacterium]
MGLFEVKERISQAELESRRVPGSVNLIAVSKKQSHSRVLEVLDMGHRVFGENRVQEASEKWPLWREKYSDVTLHLLGPLQSNKVKDAIRLFDVVHTLDREKLAKLFAENMEKTGKRLELFIQVNTGSEPQKSGVLASEIDAFIHTCSRVYELPIVGLMCLPPINEEASLHFALLKKIAERNGLSRLSMGMSSDYQSAIALGATDIRVGSAIFGARESQ